VPKVQCSPELYQNIIIINNIIVKKENFTMCPKLSLAYSILIIHYIDLGPTTVGVPLHTVYRVQCSHELGLL